VIYGRDSDYWTLGRMSDYPTWVVFLIVVGPMVALPTLWFVLSLRTTRKVAKDLMKNGEVAEAEILGYTQDELIWVQYKFTTSRGKAVSCNKPLLHGYKRLPIGTKVPVRYMKAHPTISVLEPYAASQDAS
jgi:hypothetical protein